jgi:protein involved in polysaccharide export with SLBB domain
MKTFSLIALLAVIPLITQAGNQTAATSATLEQAPTVGGQVRRPGPVNLKKDLTLYEAVQAAGGPTEFGAMRRIKVIRDGETLVFDLTDDRQKLVPVKPRDIIEVPPKNFFGR